MSVMATDRAPLAPFWHEAFFYEDDRQYLDRILSFVDEGLRGGEHVLVALPARRLQLVQGAADLGRSALVQFATMEDIGRNPARIIPAWADFVRAHGDPERGVRGVGEPIWPARDADELVECCRHEALLNVAFADAPGFRLLCPYDLAALGSSVIEGAHRNHPHLSSASSVVSSDAYRAEVPAWLDEQLPPPPARATTVPFAGADLPHVRRLVEQAAGALDMSSERVDEVVLAVSEAGANSVLHGGGSGVLALWSDVGRLFCEVRDAGRIDDRLAGRVRPTTGQHGGRGLWLMNQVSDLVQHRVQAGGQVIRLRFAP